MASGPSTAYVSFRAALRQAESLMRLERTFADPPRPTDQDAVDGLRGGAVVLMVAAFEAFLRDVFAERIDDLTQSRSQPSFSKFPEKMRIAAVFNLLDNVVRGVPGQRSMSRLDRLPDIQIAAGHISAGRLIGAAFAVTGGNANSEIVTKLFTQVDRQKVLVGAKPRFETLWRNSVPRRFLPDKLDWIVLARNEVAHGASALSWSRADLREAERFLRILAKTLDDDLRIYLNRVGRAPPTP